MCVSEIFYAFVLRISMQVASRAFLWVCGRVVDAVKNNILLLRVPPIDCYNIDCNKQSLAQMLPLAFREGV